MNEPDFHDLDSRQHTLFTSTISGDVDGEPTILGQNLTTVATHNSFPWIVGSLWLGRPLKSVRTAKVIDLALRLLVDHGPYVSGAINTIISARAGRDLVSSLVSGLLTIGPRFGGALNSSAKIWFDAVLNAQKPFILVEDFAQRKEYISGIGHRKYRVDLPDPRIPLLMDLMQGIPHPHLDFALSVSVITVTKLPNLILNIDGALSAILLDLLLGEEKLSQSEVKALLDAEFFNAIFVLSRSVGFIAHYLDQKRLDEPLFRLPEGEVLTK